MILKQLEGKGSGIILDVTKKRVLQLAPKVYTATWEVLLKGKGDYAVIIGAGTAEREVFFSLEGQDLTHYQLPTIHCYDVAEKPPRMFLERKKQFSDIKIEYFPNTNLNTFQLPKKYVDDTRLISIHGVLDYLTPIAITGLLSQIKTVRPDALSFRLCLMRGNFFKDNATSEQLRLEQFSIERIKSKVVTPITLKQFSKSGVIQVPLSAEHKVKHNLSPRYPASCIVPGNLVGFLINEGYATSAVEEYSDNMNSNLALFMKRKENV
ncbi:hypothetical protein KKB40_04565 [Patescibacteria group bacterium]|nr:hypothetical protein [Patescibacteria group bacterium]